MATSQAKKSVESTQLVDTLSHPHLWQILTRLSIHNPRDENEFDHRAPAFSSDSLGGELFHNHLPKLDEAGFIDWKRERGVVRRGPRFPEIAPLIHLSNNHQGILPQRVAVTEDEPRTDWNSLKKGYQWVCPICGFSGVHPLSGQGRNALRALKTHVYFTIRANHGDRETYPQDHPEAELRASVSSVIVKEPDEFRSRIPIIEPVTVPPEADLSVIQSEREPGMVT